MFGGHDAKNQVIFVEKYSPFTNTSNKVADMHDDFVVVFLQIKFLLLVVKLFLLLLFCWMTIVTKNLVEIDYN